MIVMTAKKENAEVKIVKKIPKKAQTIKKKPASPPEMKNFPTIRKGSKETGYITLLQANLKNRGYYDNGPTGKFDDELLAAVKEFQKDVGMPIQNGTVDAKTWEKLQSSTTVKISRMPVDPMVVRGNSSEYEIRIGGLTRYQAEVLAKLFKEKTACQILPESRA